MDKILYTPNNDRNSYNLWMAYPACESFALSSLGYLWLSKIADEFSGINSERVYTDTDYTKISAKEVQAIAFSISFDFDYIGVLDFLKKYSIPFLSKDRNNEHPLIFAGGPVITTNLSSGTIKLTSFIISLVLSSVSTPKHRFFSSSIFTRP